jgi:hypothetical protein
MTAKATGWSYGACYAEGQCPASDPDSGHVSDGPPDCSNGQQCCGSLGDVAKLKITLA